jgi:schlafen family protein
MANSAGGQIIYGIEKDKKTHKPTRVDDGVTDDKITREWLNQILSSNIHPRIDVISVQRIPLSDTGFGFVISVGSTQNGPHQSPNKIYCKRFELEAKAMEDYEVRDILRRATRVRCAARGRALGECSDGRACQITVDPIPSRRTSRRNWIGMIFRHALRRMAAAQVNRFGAADRGSEMLSGGKRTSPDIVKGTPLSLNGHQMARLCLERPPVGGSLFRSITG